MKEYSRVIYDRQPPQFTKPATKPLDVLDNISYRMEAMRRSRAVWFVLAIAGWLTALYLYLR